MVLIIILFVLLIVVEPFISYYEEGWENLQRIFRIMGARGLFKKQRPRYQVWADCMVRW